MNLDQLTSGVEENLVTIGSSVHQCEKICYPLVHEMNPFPDIIPIRTDFTIYYIAQTKSAWDSLRRVFFF
jgi:hypothetical protein